MSINFYFPYFHLSYLLKIGSNLIADQHEFIFLFYKLLCFKDYFELSFKYYFEIKKMHLNFELCPLFYGHLKDYFIRMLKFCAFF